jgi:hypothetical protein
MNFPKANLHCLQKLSPAHQFPMSLRTRQDFELRKLTHQLEIFWRGQQGRDLETTRQVQLTSKGLSGLEIANRLSASGLEVTLLTRIGVEWEVRL